MSNSPTARIFLGINAAFSILTGAVLVTIPETVNLMMFVEPEGWKPVIVRLLGVGLVIFAFDLIVMATNRFVTKSETLLIVAADAGWTAASLLTIVFLDEAFTSEGVLAVEIVATFVALLAIGQYVGAGQIVAPLSKARVRFSEGKVIASVKRHVKAPPSTVWEVMTDHPGYADVANNLSKVEILSGDGIGMMRRCFGLKGESWVETCNIFEKGHAFGFNIHTDAPDYPYPISELNGRWAIEPSDTGSAFSIEIAAKPKGGIIARKLFALVARRRFNTVLVELADAWAERMEREALA